MQRVTDASRAEHEAEIAKLKQTHESEQAEMRKHARDEHEAEIVKLKQTYESEQAEILSYLRAPTVADTSLLCMMRPSRFS